MDGREMDSTLAGMGGDRTDFRGTGEDGMETGWGRMGMEIK